MLVIRINAHISTLRESAKKMFHHWVIDGFQHIIGFQVLFSDIGGLITLVNQYVIPGHIFWRARFCDRLVPLFRRLEILVNIDYHAAIAKQAMVYQFTN
jgi:hypothetical protein